MQAGTFAASQVRPTTVDLRVNLAPLVLAAALSVLLAGVLALAFLWASPEPRESTTVALDALLLAICMFPGIRWLFGARQAVPVFECICLSYAMHFGVTPLLRANLFVQHFTDAGTLMAFTEDDLTATLVAVIAGIVAMQLAYALYSVSSLPKRLPVVEIALSSGRLHRYLLTAVIGGLALVEARGMGFTPSSDSPVGAILNVFASQLTVAVAILSYLVFSGRPHPPIYSRLLILSVVGSVWLGLTTAQFENVLVVPVAIALTTLQLRRHFMLLILAAIAVGYVFLFQPVKIEYRKLLVQSNVEFSLPERIALWYVAFVDVVTPTSDSTATTAPASSSQSGADTSDALVTVRDTLARVDYTHFFELVRLDTPDMIPYYGGSSYQYFFVGWIPRAIWPDKPSALDGNNAMVVDYGLLSDVSVQSTSAGLGLLPEAYANFGDLGMLVIMAIQGIVLAAVFRAFTASARIGPQAVLLSVSIFLINGVGGITTVMYSGLLQNLAANALLLWLAAGRTDVLSRLAERVSQRLGLNQRLQLDVHE